MGSIIENTGNVKRLDVSPGQFAGVRRVWGSAEGLSQDLASSRGSTLDFEIVLSGGRGTEKGADFREASPRRSLLHIPENAKGSCHSLWKRISGQLAVFIFTASLPSLRAVTAPTTISAALSRFTSLTFITI